MGTCGGCGVPSTHCLRIVWPIQWLPRLWQFVQSLGAPRFDEFAIHDGSQGSLYPVNFLDIHHGSLHPFSIAREYSLSPVPMHCGAGKLFSTIPPLCVGLPRCMLCLSTEPEGLGTWPKIGASAACSSLGDWAVSWVVVMQLNPYSI